MIGSWQSIDPNNIVTDLWCVQNCSGGIHPACMTSSGVHQKCGCRNNQPQTTEVEDEIFTTAEEILGISY